MFRIALALSEQLGVNFLPYAIAVMFAASASFITPLGYQTNLMVYGLGHYEFAGGVCGDRVNPVGLVVLRIVLRTKAWGRSHCGSFCCCGNV
jgi:Na+/H+ antiporter NhaD/arsenite permease-like protein